MSKDVKQGQSLESNEDGQQPEQVSAPELDSYLIDMVRTEFADISERFYFVFSNILAGKMEDNTASHLAEILLKAMDLRQESQPETTDIVCRKGCSHCCKSLVTASAPELFYLADHIKRLPGDRSVAVQDKIAQAAEKVTGLNAQQRIATQILCPLLAEDGSCSVYDLRPLSCRAFVSFDVDACVAEAAGKEVGVPSGPNGQTQRLLLIIAFKRALKEKGRDIASLEMISGLHKILTTPNLVDKWSEGEIVFDQQVYGDREAHEAWLEKMVEDLTSYQMNIPETDLSYIPGKQVPHTTKLN